MAKRTVSDSESQALEKAAAYLPGGSNGNTVTMDMVIRGGRGPRVWDLSGNEYIDYALGSGPMLIGHANPEVVAAVSEQLSQGTTYFGLNEHAILLADCVDRLVASFHLFRREHITDMKKTGHVESVILIGV